jgi:nickel transport protein
MPGKPTLRIKRMKGRLVFPLALVLFLIAVPRVNAHGINVTARVEGDRVFTESYFSNKIKVIDGQIKVFGPNGEQLLEGKTDANGIFSFKIPQETDLKIVLESAMGHRAEYVLQADEIMGKSVRKIRKERSPGFYKVIGGVGIILGLMVLILYFKSRKRKSAPSPKRIASLEERPEEFRDLRR